MCLLGIFYFEWNPSVAVVFVQGFTEGECLYVCSTGQGCRSSTPTPWLVLVFLFLLHRLLGSFTLSNTPLILHINFTGFFLVDFFVVVNSIFF